MLDRATSARLCLAVATGLVLTPSAAHAQGASPSAAIEPPPDLPKPPDVSDPLLAPPPDAPRVLSSWDEALAWVKQRSPDYLTSRASVLRAEAQARLALVPLLPNLTGQASYTHQFLVETFAFSGVTFQSPAADTVGVAATLNVPIVNPRGIYAQKTAKESLEAARLGFVEERREIAVSLVHSMLATLAAARAAELNRVGLHAALERLELAKTKVRFRQGTMLDVERAEEDAEAAKRTLIAGDESLRQTRESLGVAVGSSVPVSAPGDLKLEDFENAVIRSCKLEGDIETRGDVAAAKKRVVVAERTVKDAWLQLAPSLLLQSQLAYTSDPVLTPATTWYVEGILNVPIYDGGMAAAMARDARGAAEQSRQALASTRLSALVNVAQSERAVSVLTASRDVAQRQRDLAKSVDQRTREGYLHGLGTSLDLVTSAESLRDAELNLALLEFQVSEARVNAVLSHAECDY
jgi:outer membrane protein, multidrug efflux system